MDDRELDPIERQLVSIPAAPAPAGLRASVLAGVNRRLRAERRDRLLARAAGILLIVGIGLNAAVGIGEKGLGTGPATSGVRLEAVTLSAQVV
ncbi:MAG TPA: hypothetical protein VKB78_15355, partial [Pirellulales bacterium]|nr:hypothetical protein [Pirellulales bacterium]